MKKNLLFTLFLMVSVTMFGQKLPFQGKLIEAGTPVAGTHTFEFEIAAAEWSEIHADVPVTDGLYFVVLGSINPLPNRLFSVNDEQSLDISVDGTALSSVLLFKPLLPPLNVKNDANVPVALIGVNDATQNGELILNGSNANPNVSMLGSGPEGNNGGVTVHDENGDAKANMFTSNNSGAFSILGKTGGAINGLFQWWNPAAANLPALFFDGSIKNNIYLNVNNRDSKESGQIGISSTADEAMVLTPYSIWIKRSAADNNGSQGTYAQVLAENWNENGKAGYIGVSGPTTTNISIGAHNDNRELPKMTLIGSQNQDVIQMSAENDGTEAANLNLFSIGRGSSSFTTDSWNMNGPNSNNIQIQSKNWENAELPWLSLNGERINLMHLTGIGGSNEFGYIHLMSEDGSTSNVSAYRIENNNGNGMTGYFGSDRTTFNDNGQEMTYNAYGISGSGQLSIANGVSITGDVVVNGVTEHSSDRRFKKDINSLAPNTLAKIQLIKGVSYNWRQDEFPEKHFSSDKQIGLIAQELEAQFPELVKTNKEGYKSVNYNGFTAALLEAVKELNAKVEKLEAENKQLKAELSASAANAQEIEALKAQMQTVLKAVQEAAVIPAGAELTSTPGLK